jgi:hypothetical protein
MAKWTVYLIALVCTVAAACESANVGPTGPAGPAAPITSRPAFDYIDVDGPEEVPDSMPVEFYEPTDVSVVTSAAINSASGYAIAALSFFATNGDLRVDATLKHGTTVVGRDSSLSHNYKLIPWSDSLGNTASVSVPDPCGHTIDGQFTYRVWNEITLVMPTTSIAYKWGEKGASTNKNASQPVCGPPPEPLEGWGDYDEEDWTVICEDVYEGWYDPDTYFRYGYIHDLELVWRFCWWESPQSQEMRVEPTDKSGGSKARPKEVRAGAATVARIAGMGRLKSGKPVQVGRMKGEKPVIMVDTTSATAADVAAAIRALELLEASAAPGDGRVEVLAVEGAREKNYGSALGRQAAQQYLQQLRSASQKLLAGVGQVRSIDIRIRPTLGNMQDSPPGLGGR